MFIFLVPFLSMYYNWVCIVGYPKSIACKEYCREAPIFMVDLVFDCAEGREVDLDLCSKPQD